MKYALSLDGGGVRGAVQATILAHIEDTTGRRIQDIFELYAGTSTGGLVVLKLAMGTPPSEIRDFYVKQSCEIFPKNLWWGIKSGNGLLGPKYDVTPLQNLAKQHFRDKTMGQVMEDGYRVMIPTYCLDEGAPKFFKSHDKKDADVLVRDVALATSAAPTFFYPHWFNGKGYCDGGIYANNPCVSTIVEEKNIFGDDIKVLSLGGGGADVSFDSKKSHEWGGIGWLKRIINLIFDGVSDDDDHIAGSLLGENFLRIQEDSFGITSMDDGSAQNMKACVDFGDYVWEKNKDAILKFLDFDPLAKL